MLSCIWEQVRNHPSLIFFYDMKLPSYERAALTMNSLWRPPTAKGYLSLVEGFNSSSRLCLPLENSNTEA